MYKTDAIYLNDSLPEPVKEKSEGEAAIQGRKKTVNGQLLCRSYTKVYTFLTQNHHSHTNAQAINNTPHWDVNPLQ